MAGFRVFGFSVAQVGFYLVQGRKITPGTFAFANVRVLEDGCDYRCAFGGDQARAAHHYEFVCGISRAYPPVEVRQCATGSGCRYRYAFGKCGGESISLNRIAQQAHIRHF